MGDLILEIEKEGAGAEAGTVPGGSEGDLLGLRLSSWRSVFSGRHQHHFLCFLIKSNLKQNPVSALTDDGEGKQLMRKYLSGKKFPGHSAQLIFLNTKENCEIDTNKSTPTTSLSLVFSVPAGEVGCLRLGGGRVVVWVVAGLTGRVGSEREREREQCSQSSSGPTTTQQSPQLQLLLLLLRWW